jgi:hypothetical protein
VNGKVVRIERTQPRPGGTEQPSRAANGRYQLADPKFGSLKHHAEHAVFVHTLEEAAALIERGFSLWMTREGKRPSLISPNGLRIVRAP